MRGENITLSFGTNIIYDNAEFNIPSRAKCGIVGVNGAGKTTLFKVILGQIKLDAGFIDVGGENIGYLPQQVEIENPDVTVWDFVAGARPIAALESELNDLYVVLAQNPDDENIQNKIDAVQKRLDYYDIYNAEAVLLEIIENMQLTDFIDLPVAKLSGGQKSKVAFARLLYSVADLLLLDEPTNHLDAASPTNHSIKKAGHTRAAQLQKILAHRTQRDVEYKRVKMDLTPLRDGARFPIMVDNLWFRYPGKKLLYRNLSFHITGGERFLIVGENGAGKSTLLKLIMGFLTPERGIIDINPKTDIAYYAQEQEQLDLNKTVMENVETPEYTDLQLRAALANFLFFDMDVFKRVGTLSPGERARVALCKLLLKRANMLILDEPTNHLDPETQMIIGDNFRDFPGTIIVVSHNPEFVEQIGITRMLVLPAGRIEDYDHEKLEYYYSVNSEK